MTADAGREAAEVPDSDAFAFFSLRGDRFDAPGLPADTAREVGHFREAVLQVARRLWLDNHGRQRLPSGFSDAFDLRLVGVLEGSARPQLVLNRASSGVDDSDWDEWVSYYASARDTVAEAVGAVAKTERLPDSFPVDGLRALRRIGSSLQDSESVELGSPVESSRRAVLDRSVRELLEEIDEALPPAPVDAFLVGVITEYDGATVSFRLRTDTGISTCRLEQFNAGLAQRAKEVLALDGVTAPDVRVLGKTLDPDRRQVQLFDVHGIELVRTVEEKVLVNRLNDLSALERDWLGPNSTPPSDEVLDRAQRLVPALSTLGLAVAVVPNAEGALVFEWRRGDFELTAAIEPNGEMFLCADNTVTDEVVEEQAPYDEARIERFLRTGSMA